MDNDRGNGTTSTQKNPYSYFESAYTLFLKKLIFIFFFHIYVHCIFFTNFEIIMVVNKSYNDRTHVLIIKQKIVKKKST